MARLLEFIHGGTFVVGSLFNSQVGWSLLCQLVGLSNIGGEEETSNDPPGNDYKNHKTPAGTFEFQWFCHGFFSNPRWDMLGMAPSQ